MRRFRNAFGAAQSSSSQAAQPAAATPAVQAAPSTTPAPRPVETLQGSESSGQRTPASSSESQPSALAPAAAPEQGRSALQEKLARHEAIKKREAEEAERRRQAKGKGRAEPEDEPEDEAAAEEGGGGANKVIARKQAAQTYKQKQLEQRSERARILKQIEDDKAARRAREAERKAERQMAMEGAQQETPAGPAASKASSSSKRSEYCALQVRLLDGSTIRTRLPSGTSLRTEVRKWVDESRGDGDRTPYTFRLILTPLPNKNIDDTEEDQTLEALGLTPSATLVLVPGQNYSAAYGGSGGSLLSRLFGLILGFFTGIITFFTTIFTGAQTPPSPPTAPEEHQMQNVPGRGNSSGSSSSIRPQPPRERRVRGFRNADDERDQQLYNGNSVSPKQWRYNISWGSRLTRTS